MRLLVVLAALLLAGAPAAEAEVRKGPGGLAFYSPPKRLVAGSNGTLVWARKLTGTPALKGAGSNRLLLYRTAGKGADAPSLSSGTLAVPKGRPPKGGWPVISWAHGTTGIADRCAPSRDSASNPAHGLIDSAYPLLRRWLKAGFAVVRTDYSGLGTPGDHEYLNGYGEAYSVLDAVVAARRLDKRLSTRVVLAGHSQGGQSVLWAAAKAPGYAPGLRIRGTLALAPVSHLEEQAARLPGLTAPSGLSGLIAMILRGLDLGDQRLGVSAALGERAAQLYPQTLTECLPALTAASSFGALAPAELIRQDVDAGPAYRALGRLTDPESLHIRTPLRIQQGTADATVFKPFTDQLVSEYRELGNHVTYATYESVDHGGAVEDARSAADATKYVRARLR
jgi:pimeloyl-ACP methyl ester carboxylesterase